MTSPLHIGSPYRPSVLLALMSVLAAGPVACAPKGEALYAEAKQALAKGDVDTAIIHLRNFVAADPNHAAGRALLGQALVESGAIQAGGIEIRKAKELGAPREMTLVPECDVLVAERDFDAVLANCQPESAPESTRPALEVDTGLALMGLQRPQEAEAHFRAALATQPENTRAVLGVATSVYATSGLGPARAILESAPDSVRNEARYWLAAGGLEISAGDMPAAEAGLPRGAAALPVPEASCRAHGGGHGSDRGAVAPGQDERSAGYQRCHDRSYTRQFPGEDVARPGAGRQWRA